MGRSNQQDYEYQKKGDIAYDKYHDSWDVLHVGTSGQFLWVSGGLPAYRTLVLGDVGSVFGTPAIVLGTAAAAGAAATTIRSDSTIVAFDTTAPVTQAFGDAAATGSVALAARRDHKHGMPAFGAWTTFTPTITSGSGTFTTVSGSGAYFQLGKHLFFHLLISITTNGTAATDIRFSLPLSLTALGAQAVSGTTSANIALSCWVQTGTGVVTITKYDGTYPGANNTFPIISGTVEVS